MSSPSLGQSGGLLWTTLFKNHSMRKCVLSIETIKKNYDMPSVMNVHKLHPPKEWTGPVLCGWNVCLGRCLCFKSQKFTF